MNASSFSTERQVSSLMLRPPTVTESASLESRAPPQSGQGSVIMNCSISLRESSLCDSLYLRLRLFITPSKAV